MSQRPYFCGLAAALQLVSGPWTLMLIRELSGGPRRFSDLEAGLPGISPNSLTRRLRELQERGLITRERLPPPAGSYAYELTDSGYDLAETLAPLTAWGARVLPEANEAEVRVSWLLATAAAGLSDEDAGKLEGVWEFRGGGDDVATLRIRGGEVSITHGGAADADATVTGKPKALVELLRSGANSGTVEVEGDRRSVRELLKRLRLPAVD